MNPIQEIIEENARRLQIINAPFDPLTGEGAPGDRFLHQGMWLPVSMQTLSLPDTIEGEEWERLRCQHDFPYWAARYVKVKNKIGGDDVPFILTRPQRKFITAMENARLGERPIRFVLLKARQWGGSTTAQIYMAWFQLIHRKGVNSLIIAHQSSGSYTIKDMYDRLLEHYPQWLLHQPGERYKEDEPKMRPVGRSGSIFRIPARNCKITIGSAERPHSCRSGDYTFVHCSEVGIWKATAGKTPEDILRSACSGILLRPGTIIIYESTANGTGNFFQKEYDAAASKMKKSQFEALFISWHDIDLYSTPFPTEEEREAFARRLWEGRKKENPLSDREESGRYLWMLWEKGATLEAINWYIEEREKYSDHAQMASEYPSDDVEAFAHSGVRVFDRYKVEALRGGCAMVPQRGEVTGEEDTGAGALRSLHFVSDTQGGLQVWKEPDKGDRRSGDRYIAVVDIGGRSVKADWSVIVVLDREGSGGKPEVVAQWYGHTDMDLLAWKAATIAKWYGEALLVIESNTLETHDRDRNVEGDQSHFILNQLKEEYPNLYARRQSEQAIAEGAPVRYGFHTNISTKPMVISSLVKVIREGLYIERDERCLDEYLTYEKKPNGSFGAIPGKHDDLLMTRAIGLHLCFHELPPRSRGADSLSYQRALRARVPY